MYSVLLRISITMIFLLGLCFHDLYSQIAKDTLSDNFYFYWGYNRSWYTDSDIHFNGPNYDLTFYNLKASDRPSPLNWDYINPLKFTVPQYNFRLGYRIRKSLFVSFGVDHMKYVVDQNQLTTISGVISEEFSPTYGGNYLNEEIILDRNLLKFEHTDGFNLVSLDFEYLFYLKNLKPFTWDFRWNFGMGGIWIVTKTNIKILNEGLDNDFHVAGFTFQGKTGPRLSYKNKYFIQSEFKTGYASLPFILVKNSEPEQGDQNLIFFEFYFVFGINF